MSTRRSLVPLLALGAVSVGCFGVSYQARRAPLGDPSFPAAHVEGVDTWANTTTPGAYVDNDSNEVFARVTRSGFEVEHRNHQSTRGVRWDVRLQGSAEVDVLDMMWSPPTAPRCQGGHPALAILLDPDEPPDHGIFAQDRQVHWERPVVVRGERVLSGRFDEDPDLLRRPSIVDVRLVEREGAAAREVCVRVPVTGPDVTYWNTKRWSGGIRLSFRNALAFTRSSTFAAGVSLGRWVGPVRLGLEGIIGGTNGDSPDKDSPTGTALCFAAPGPDCDSVHLGGFAVEASGLAGRWGRNFGVGWSLGYEVLFAGLERLDPMDGSLVSRHAVSGGPRLGVRLLAAAPDIVGASRFSPTSAWAVELFVAAPQEWIGAADGSRLNFGVALTTF